jgi:predicted secreted protein
MQRRVLALSAIALAVGGGALGAQTQSRRDRSTQATQPPQADSSSLANPPQQLDPSSFAEPPPRATSASDVWPKGAFETTAVDAVLAALGIANPQPGTAVLLDAPDIALAAQPIRLAVETTMPKVNRVVLLADRLRFPLLAVIAPPAGRLTRVAVDVHLPRASRVRAYVRSDAGWFLVQREVKLALERA